MGSISISLHPEQKAIAPSSITRLYVALRVTAAGEPLERRPPLSTVLALDASGSMAGPPIEHVIASVEAIADMVDDSDAIGVVLFADRASVFLPMTVMDSIGRRTLKGRVRRLRADGHTNIEDALVKAVELLENEPVTNKKSVVLLSDGEPNRGAASPAALAALATNIRSRAAVATLGYGVRHNEDVLTAISDAGGGRYHFIQDAKLCQRQITIAVGAQADVVVDGIELLVRPAPGVELVRFVAQSNVRFKNGGAAIPIADMEDGAERIIALELVIDGAQVLLGRLADVEVRYRDPKSQITEVWASAVEVDVRDGGGSVDPAAAALVLLARVEEERTRARHLADRQQFDGAAAILRNLLAEIEAAPGYAPADGSDLWEAHELLVDEIAAFERRPDAEAYTLFRKQTMHLKVTDHSPSQISIRRGSNTSKLLEVMPSAAPPAQLVALDGANANHVYPIGDRCTIGRTAAADVVLEAPEVSRRHAEIFAADGAHWISDLGSTNATCVNGVRLTAGIRSLANGDVIQIGELRLRYERL
ncbi:MAG: VWA domain-containing protein [Polyangiaceae bacterium]